MNKILLALLICALTASVTFNRSHTRPRIEVTKQDSALNVDDSFLAIFSVGNKRLLSSLLWISTLLESDMEHYKNKDLNSWLYLRFNSIARLDPLFLNNYTFGGQYLSIIKDDILGAEQILLKGIAHYPDEFQLVFSLAYLYVFEKQDYVQGLKYYEKLDQFPNAPRNTKSLIHKIKFYQAGQDLSIAYDSILLTYEQTKDQDLKNKLRVDLYAIRAELDLECLNAGRSDCNQRDFEGNPYIRKGGRFESPKTFAPYQLYHRKGSEN